MDNTFDLLQSTRNYICDPIYYHTLTYFHIKEVISSEKFSVLLVLNRAKCEYAVDFVKLLLFWTPAHTFEEMGHGCHQMSILMFANGKVSFLEKKKLSIIAIYYCTVLTWILILINLRLLFDLVLFSFPLFFFVLLSLSLRLFCFASSSFLFLF